MIPDQTLRICVKFSRKKVREYLASKGYDVSQKYIDVDVHDLIACGSTSDVPIKIICDYCWKPIDTTLANYMSNKKRDYLIRDCCKDCIPLKAKDSCWVKYDGIHNVALLPSVKEKKRKTCLERYGCESPMQNKEIQNKVKETNLKRYGCEYVAQNEVIKQKQRNSLYKNGSIPTSKQQLSVYEMLKSLGYKCELNYPYGPLNLDIALFIDGIKIDVEYDGWFWHKDSGQKDAARNAILLNEGWKIIRIRGNEFLPTLEQLQNCIDNAINQKHNLQFITLEDWENKNRK